VWKNHAFRFVQGDICYRDTVSSLLEGAHAVVHFAAESGVDPGWAAEALGRIAVKGVDAGLSDTVAWNLQNPEWWAS